MARLDQIARPPDLRQLFPQQFHRMRTGRQVHPFIIRLDPFRQRHGGERRTVGSARDR